MALSAAVGLAIAALCAGPALAGAATSPAAASSSATSSAAVADPATAAGVRSAALVATQAGYRTGVAVLDLSTGALYDAGEATAAFASESVAKVLIATELLATGQMTGSTEATAYQMITQSDDDDADALYGLAGGDDVINLVADRYQIASLGTAPDESGWWGNTEINAEGMVRLYAAIAKDPVVGPWLMNAMAHTTEFAADGTDQFFGIPAATTGAAIKQGWGDDGDDSPNAVFNSTGYVENDTYAVAILTDGDSSTYGQRISDTVTAQATALMPSGRIPVQAPVTAVTPVAVPPSTPPATAPAAVSSTDSVSAATPSAAAVARHEGAGRGAAGPTSTRALKVIAVPAATVVAAGLAAAGAILRRRRLHAADRART